MTAQAEVSSVHDDEAHDRDEGLSYVGTVMGRPSAILDTTWVTIVGLMLGLHTDSTQCMDMQGQRLARVRRGKGSDVLFET